jgi:hypothetical protein
MKRMLAVVLVGLAALALPTLAVAKELTKAEICGVDKCATVTGAALQRLANTGDGITDPAPAPGRFYKVRFTIEHEGESDSWSIYYVPGDRLGLQDGQWEQIGPAALAEYKRATRGLKPFPAPTLERVIIDGRAVKDPASYAALYTAGTTDDAVPSGVADWVPVEMTFGRAETPWSGSPYVYFSSHNGMVQRGIDIVRLPGGMAADVRAGRSLDLGHGFPWALVAVIALGVALAATGAIWLARRRQPAASTRRNPVPT